ADRLTENPVIRHRLRPQRVDFEARRLDGGIALRFSRPVENRLRDAERDQECENTRTDDDRAIPRELPHLSTLAFEGGPEGPPLRHEFEGGPEGPPLRREFRKRT